MDVLKNKKGILPIIAVVIGVVLIATIIILSSGVRAGNSITSLTPKDQSCSAKPIPVVVKGSAFTKDTAFFGVVAEPERIEVSQVRSPGLLGVFSSDFTWKVSLIDVTTGNEVASDRGTSNHPGGNVLVEDEFTLGFNVPDNDCDGFVDDFDGKLVFDVRNDNGDEFSISQTLEFQNGRYIR